MYAASCADESELYGHAIACGNVLYNNTGVLPNCDEIGDCVVNQAALTTKWPNLAKNDIASPTAVNLTFGDSGIDGVADDEVECSGSPVTLTLNCTDDRVGGAPAAAGAGGGSCTPLPPPLNVDNDCDGVDEDCLNGADDGYVSSGSCQVAGTNPACPAEEVTGSYICQSGSEVCDAGGLVATCPPTCTPTGSPDTNCDGVDDDCNGTADDGYVSTSCQVANTNATCPTEEVTGSTSCVAGSVVCDDLGQVATCPTAGYQYPQTSGCSAECLQNFADADAAFEAGITANTPLQVPSQCTDSGATRNIYTDQDPDGYSMRISKWINGNDCVTYVALIRYGFQTIQEIKYTTVPAGSSDCVWIMHDWAHQNYGSLTPGNCSDPGPAPF